MGMCEALDRALNQWSREIDQVAREVNTLLSLPNKNFCQLQALEQNLRQRVKNASDSIREQSGCEKLPKMATLFMQDASRHARDVLQRCKEEISTHPDELKLHTRWERLGFAANVVESHPDFVEFALTSGLGFSICGFRETQSEGQKTHTVQVDPDGMPKILVEGTWTRWDEVKNRVGYDKTKEIFYTLANPEELWTYISPNGLTPVDRLQAAKPFAIHELTETEYQALLEHSKEFFNGETKDPHPELEKEAVMQIFTSPGSFCNTQNKVLKKMGSALPSHYAMRVITKDRKVYSFSLQMDRGEPQHLQGPFKIGTQIMGKIAMLDYDEFRPHQGRVVTSIPIGSQTAEEILQEVARFNQSEPTFDFGKDNCVKVVGNLLQKAGFEVDLKVSFGSFLGDTIASVLKQVPGLGWMMKKVERCSSKVIRQMPQMPSFLDKPVKKIAKVVFYVPNKLGTLIKNLLCLALGTWRASPRVQASNSVHKRKFSWKRDLFRDDFNNVNHSKQLLNWQKKQKTTLTHAYSGKPKLNILP